MSVFWVTFRIHNNASYEARYAALKAAVESHVSGKCWDEPTSFGVFESSSTSTALAAAFKEAIDVRIDQVVIGSPLTKTMVVLGKVDDMRKLKSMVDFAKQS